jgi:hypothetical protein
MLYILNESTMVDQAGDVDIYTNLERLVLQTEAIDVRNGNYFAYTSDGRLITLSADADYGPVKASIAASQSHRAEVEKVLRDYLLYFANDGRFGIDEDEVRSANQLETLVALIPSKLVTEL